MKLMKKHIFLKRKLEFDWKFVQKNLKKKFFNIFLKKFLLKTNKKTVHPSNLYYYKKVSFSS